MLRRRVVQHSCDAAHNQSDSGSGGSVFCSTAFLWSNSGSVRQTVGLEGLVCACTSVFLFLSALVRNRHSSYYAVAVVSPVKKKQGLSTFPLPNSIFFILESYVYDTNTGIKAHKIKTMYVSHFLPFLIFWLLIVAHKMLQHRSCETQETRPSLQELPLRNTFELQPANLDCAAVQHRSCVSQETWHFWQQLQSRSTFELQPANLNCAEVFGVK